MVIFLIFLKLNTFIESFIKIVSFILFITQFLMFASSFAQILTSCQ